MVHYQCYIMQISLRSGSQNIGGIWKTGFSLKNSGPHFFNYSEKRNPYKPCTTSCSVRLCTAQLGLNCGGHGQCRPLTLLLKITSIICRIIYLWKWFDLCLTVNIHEQPWTSTTSKNLFNNLNIFTLKIIKLIIIIIIIN